MSAGAPSTAAQAEPCVTCRRPSGTPYCLHCGERRAADRPLHLSELFGELWGEFVSVDGRVVRSFSALVFRPGALTAAYVRGERQRYLKPLKVFLTVNVLFFVFATTFGIRGFTAPLVNHLHVFGHHAIAERLVSARIAERHVSLATYTNAFDAVAVSQAKTLLLALVPMFAVCVACAQLPRRRPALEHVVFALHAVSVWLLILMAAFYSLRYGLRYALVAVVRARAWLDPAHGAAVMYDLSDNAFSFITVVVFFAWLAPALRRNYGGGWAPNVVRAAALAWCVLPILVAYRALLFFTTFWAT